MTTIVVIDMLSVGAVHFEDRFCPSRKGGTGVGAWVGVTLLVTVHGGVLRLAVQKPWSVQSLSAFFHKWVNLLLCKDSISGI